LRLRQHAKVLGDKPRNFAAFSVFSRSEGFRLTEQWGAAMMASPVDACRVVGNAHFGTGSVQKGGIAPPNLTMYLIYTSLYKASNTSTYIFMQYAPANQPPPASNNLTHIKLL
jgi:hypothetical protein